MTTMVEERLALSLRSYQQPVYDAVTGAWESGVQRPVFVAPCGWGKTVVFVFLILWVLERRGGRAVVLVHSEELVEQTARAIQGVAPGLSVGVVKAGRNEVDARIVVASVQTVTNRSRAEQITGVSVVVADEAHLSYARTWQQALRHFGVLGGHTLAVGCSATFTRTKGTEALSSIWDEVVKTVPVSAGVQAGYLSNVVGRKIEVDGLDLTSVAKTQSGDFDDAELGDAIEASGVGMQIARQTLVHAGDRSLVGFAPSVRCAHYYAECLREVGISTLVVIGESDKDERKGAKGRHMQWALDNHRRRTEPEHRHRPDSVQMLMTVNALSTGFDAPWCSAALMGAPTTSEIRYIQSAGRIMRTHFTRGEGLLLDVTGNSELLKLRTIADLAGVPVRENESIRQAQQRAEQEAGESTRPGRGAGVVGTISHRDINVFEDAWGAWLTSRGGTPFLVTRGVKGLDMPATVVMIYPERTDGARGELTGAYSVVRMTARGRGKGEQLHAGCDLDDARAWAELEVQAIENAEYRAEREINPRAQQYSVTDARARWRRTAASAAQLEMAARLGIEPGSTRKGPVSDAISVHLVSGRLERFGL